MPLATTIETTDKENRDFILSLFALTVKINETSAERRTMEDMLRLTRGKSNQIFYFWLKSGMVEGDPFGRVWLTEKGLEALEQYNERHSK